MINFIRTLAKKGLIRPRFYQRAIKVLTVITDSRMRIRNTDA